MALLVAYALAGVFSAASAFWQPRGTFGLAADYGMNVRAVVPDGPAARAGIAPGDRIDLSRTPFVERRYVAGVAGVAAGAPAGTLVHIWYSTGSVKRGVTLTAVPYPLTNPDRSSLLVVCAASLLFIAVGATLIALRPSLATWGFGLYCLLVLPTASYPVALPSATGALAAVIFYDIVQNVGVVGLLLFALEFPRRIQSTRRESIRRALPLVFIVLAAMTLYPDVANLLLGIGAGLENHLLQIVFGAVFALAVYVLWDTYGRIAVDERERMRWVLIGFGLGLVGNYIGNTLLFSSLVPVDPPVWLLNALVSLNVLLPLTVAHAVIRHRVLDVDFVLSRALVYATLTATLAGLFALLDWILGHVLEDFRFSQLVEAAISIGIAFAFEALHKRVERFIEALFFKQRRAAEARLDRLAADLPQAHAVEVIERTLVAEVVDAFGLTSAAFFRHTGSANFRRTAASGWRDDDCALLDDTDLLVLAMRGDAACIRLTELPWRRSDVPRGAAAPIVGLRMRTRSTLTGIALYGGHPAGGDVDPTELAQLERLVRAAGIAFDEIEAERLRAENAGSAIRIGELQARLDELRRLHAPRRSFAAGDGSA